MISPIKKFSCLFFIIFMFCNKLIAWRSYNRFIIGGDAIGVGGAYVSDASSEIAVIYNPSGLVQINKNFTFSYEVFSSLVIQDILNWNISLKFDYFPFLSLFTSIKDNYFSLSFNTLFYSKAFSDLNIRSIKLSYAYKLFDNFSLGFGIGPIIGIENNFYSYSWNYNIGILYKPLENLQIGICLNSSFELLWSSSFYGDNLYELYPYIFEIGLTYNINRYILFYYTMEYIGLDSIKFRINNLDLSPNYYDFIDRIHPHIGIRFLEIYTGAHLSIGFFTEDNYFDNIIRRQYLLTAGFRAYGKNMIFNVSLIDSLFFYIFYPYNYKEERININFSFQIP